MTIPSSDLPPLESARNRIEAAYDPRLLKTAGRKMADLLGDHLRRVEACEEAVLNWREPHDNIAAADRFLDADNLQSFPTGEDRSTVADQFASLVRVMLEHGHNLHDPRYAGHQVPAPVPLAGLFDAVGGVTNQVMAIYEMGPWASAVEEALVGRLGELIGWQPNTFSGVATHGGSLANLTALLTARNVVLGDVWEHGLERTGPRPVLVVHADAHYSNGRAAGILGLGTNQVIRARLDSHRRIDPNLLDETLADLRKNNTPIVAVVACACATPIGAFDPLNDIADVCGRHDVWLHVDAAHGGAALFSSQHRPLLDGLDRADSLVWDAHKMLFVPALCAFVFLKDRQHRFEAFRQEAPYLFDPSAPGLADHDSGLRTVECTKRAMTFGLWGVWSLFGRQLFADMVDVTFAMGKIFHDKLTDADDFEPLHRPECNIVAFRYIPAALREADAERIGQFQLDLRRAVIRSGEFYIVPTQFDGIGALRVTIINPLTRPEHLDLLMETLRTQGQQLLDP